MDAEAGGYVTELGQEAIELGQGDPPPVEIVNPGARSPLLVISDHAGNAVPSAMTGNGAAGPLGLPHGAMDKHIAWDIGAAAVSRHLAASMGATAVLARYSRLLIDANRPLGDPESIPAVSDGMTIPANAHLNSAAARARAAAFYWPYHGAIAEELGRLKRQFKAEGAARVPVILSVHSFTPAMMARSGERARERPWHIGVMFSNDQRLARPLIAALRKMHGFVVGENEPYSGVTLGYCLKLHGLAQGLPHAQVEIRQDLICTPAGQKWWGDTLAVMLAPILDLDELKQVRHH